MMNFTEGQARENFAHHMAVTINDITEARYGFRLSFDRPMGVGVMTYTDTDMQGMGRLIEWGIFRKQAAKVCRLTLKVDTLRLANRTSLKQLFANGVEFCTEIQDKLLAIDCYFHHQKRYDQLNRSGYAVLFLIVAWARRELSQREEVTWDESERGEWIRYKTELDKQKWQQNQQLATLLYDYSVNQLNGEFAIDRLHETFRHVASRDKIRFVASMLEGEGYLKPSNGRKPRQVTGKW